MRALHVVTLHTPTHAFGGPTRVALNLCSGLRQRDVDARLMALADGFAPGPLPTSVEGVPAFLFRAQHVLPRFEVSGITSTRLLRSAPTLLAEADVVHVHLMRDLVTLPVARMALALRKPLVLQTHGMVDPTDKTMAQVVDSLATRSVLRGADAVFYLTETERRGLTNVLPSHDVAPTIRLVNGVPDQSRRQRPDGLPVVTFLARFQQRKRPEDFVAAVPAILERVPGTRFVMAGPDSGSVAASRAAAERLGVADAIEMRGPLDHEEALALLASTWVSVLPSVDEPFPMSILEALSLGVPTVVTRTNGLADDVAGSGAGAAVLGGDTAGIADAVVALLDPDANDRASERAWDVARSRFSMSAVLDTLQAAYADALQRHTSSPI